jgi:hypothetical protein
MSDAKPKLEAVKDEKPAVRTEDEIRKALSALTRRHAVQKAATVELAAGRGDWRSVADGAADLRRLEGQIEALEYVLSIRNGIT